MLYITNQNHLKKIKNVFIIQTVRGELSLGTTVMIRIFIAFFYSYVGLKSRFQLNFERPEL